jgi:hypothetical protein
VLVSDANVLAPAVLAIPELLPLAASIRNVETLMSAFDLFLPSAKCLPSTQSGH